MANILLVANLNCDRVLHLGQPLHAGGRHFYEDNGRRLGGGGANTGLGLVFAGHHVALVSQIGNDKTADWLLAEASLSGLDCHLLQRNELETPELLLIMTPDGERTIIRPNRPAFSLGEQPDFSQWQALYLNTTADGMADWSNSALDKTLVVAQLAGDDRSIPCHILIASKSDIAARNKAFDSIWHYGLHIAGDQLQHVIITDGEHGVTSYSHHQKVFVPAIPAKVVDTTGAGDAFASGLINALVADKPLKEAIIEGINWSTIAVQTASSVPGKELKKYLSAKTVQ